MASDGHSLWVFGYGSLLWKMNFPYDSKVVGYVKGFTRRFWQGSFVHRGTQQAPGRVAVLLESSLEDTTWGVAYKVKPESSSEVMGYLNQRENPLKVGYTPHKVLFHPQESNLSTIINQLNDPFIVLAYVGTDTSDGYLGPPRSLDELVKQVECSKGESGCNSHYVLMLAKVMREIAPSAHDEHLFSLEKKLLETIGNCDKLRVDVDRTFCGVCSACTS